MEEPARFAIDTLMFVRPLDGDYARRTKFEKTDNITGLPPFDTLQDNVDAPVLLKAGDNVSTDDIIPAGTRVLPYWSNIPKVSTFAFEDVDPDYVVRAKAAKDDGRRHVIVAGANYGQGSSRENAAIAPRFLGLQAVIAKSFARIHWQNLVNFGVLPLTFAASADYEALQPGAVVRLRGVIDALRGGPEIEVEIEGSGKPLRLHHALSTRQIEILKAGGAVNWRRRGKARPHDNEEGVPS